MDIDFKELHKHYINLVINSIQNIGASIHEPITHELPTWMQILNKLTNESCELYFDEKLTSDEKLNTLKNKAVDMTVLLITLLAQLGAEEALTKIKSKNV